MKIGDEIQGRYQIRQLLGQGGMGAVFLADDRVLDQKVAIKTLLPEVVHDARSLEQLKREVKTAQKLRHENICATYHLEVSGDEPFIVMEYVEGVALSNFLFQQPEHRSDERTFRDLILQILAGVHAAHRAGIVHRDLKSRNVMVTAEGSVRIMDFGIAASLKEAYARTTGANTSLSIHYASPEQIKGDQPSPLMDIYSLGCMMYEMLAGQVPFYSGDVLSQQLTKEPPPLPKVSPEITALVMACLRKDPRQRPQTVAEICTVLGAPETIKVKRRPVRLRGKPKRRVVAYTLLAVSGALALSGGSIWYISRPTPPVVPDRPAAIPLPVPEPAPAAVPPPGVGAAVEPEPVKPQKREVLKRPERLPEEEDIKPRSSEAVYSQALRMIEDGRYGDAIVMIERATDHDSPKLREVLGRARAAQQAEEGVKEGKTEKKRPEE